MSSVVIKIGGSALDAEFEDEEHSFLQPFVSILSDLARTRRVVVIPGGGPAWDVRKAWNRKYRTQEKSTEFYSRIALETLQHNAMELSVAFGDSARLVSPENAATMSSPDAEGKVLITWSAPPNTTIPPHLVWFSDIHSLALAETVLTRFGGDTCFFLKKADGIWRWDPGLKTQDVDRLLELSARGERRDGSGDTRRQLELLRSAMRTSKNQLFKLMAAERALQGPPDFFRIGADGEDEHLIENAALRFFVGECIQLCKVAIIDVRCPSSLERYLNGEDGTSVFTRSSE